MSYAEIKAMNWSSLKHLEESALAYRERTEEPERDKPHHVFGRAGHVAILQPELWDGMFCRYPDRPFPNAAKPGTKACKESTKADAGFFSLGSVKSWADAQRAEGREPLKDSDYEAALRLRDAIARHRTARELLSDPKRVEHVIQWVDDETGVACKARLDILRNNCLADPKTAVSVRPRKFASDAAKFMYHGQVAFYHDGCIASGALPADADNPWLIAIQKAKPHDVACYEVGGVDLDAGRALYRRLLRRYVECSAADVWPGVAPEPLPLGLPTWAPGMADALAGPETVPAGEEW